MRPSKVVVKPATTSSHDVASRRIVVMIGPVALAGIAIHPRNVSEDANARITMAPKGMAQHDDTDRNPSAQPATDPASAAARRTGSPSCRPGGGQETKRGSSAAPGRPDNVVRRLDELRLASCGAVRRVDGVAGTKPLADVDPGGVA